MKRLFAAVLTVIMLLQPLAPAAARTAEPLPRSTPAVTVQSTTPPVSLDTRPYAAMLAQQTKQVQQTGSQDLSMTATDSLSALLLAGMPDGDPDEENSGSDAEHYRVTEISVDGQTAQVQYISGGAADLVVGVYSTDEKQLLASGVQYVTETDDGTAFITLTGTLPQYFVVKGYLLNPDDHFALSDTYVNTLFTEEMADLADAKTGDFDPDLVINLDDQDNTNFGVVKQDVLLLDNDTVAADENIITQDGDSYIYTVENPTEEFRNLQVGDTFVYHDANGGLLVARVKDIDEQDGSLVITGDEDLDIRDVFDVLKIDSDQDSSSFHYVEGSAEDGEDGSVSTQVTVLDPREVDFSPNALEYNGETTGTDTVDEDNGFVSDLTEQVKDLFKPKEDNDSKEWALPVHVDKEYKNQYTDDLEYSVKVKIDSDIVVNANYAYYIAWDRVYVAGSAALSMKGVYGVEADLKATMDLGEYKAYDVMTGISFGVSASIDVELNAKATVTLLTTATIGGAYQLGYGFQNLSKDPYYQMTADAEVMVKATMHISPYIAAVYDVAQLHFNLTFVDTLTAHAIIRGADSEDVPESRDGCFPVCFAFNLQITTSADLQFILQLFPDKAEIQFDPFELWKDKELLNGDAYWSPTRGEFAFTKCPHTEYRVTATLEVTLTSHPEMDFDDLMNSGRVDDGYSGTGYITYTYNEKTGTLIISGEGAMPSFDTANHGIPCPWPRWEIKKLIVREGVTTIGNEAFSGADALTEVYLPQSLTYISYYAFAYTKNIQDIYYAGNVKDWRKVSKGTDNGAFFLAPVHCSDGEANVPMAGGDGSENDPFQIATAAQLESIQDKSDSKYYILINDIDLAGMEWAPMVRFSGVLDGQGHSIKNMTITELSDLCLDTTNGSYYVGLFQKNDTRWVQSSTGSWSTAASVLLNLNLEDVNIDLDFSDWDTPPVLAVGPLQAYMDPFYSLIYPYYDSPENCSVSGKISVTNASVYLGGLIGNGSSKAVLKNCTSDLNITLTNCTGYAGGLVGFNSYVNDSVNNSRATIVNSPDLTYDGIAGYIRPASWGESYGGINNCTDNGTVTRK